MMTTDSLAQLQAQIDTARQTLAALDAEQGVIVCVLDITDRLPDGELRDRTRLPILERLARNAGSRRRMLEALGRLLADQAAARARRALEQAAAWYTTPPYLH